MSAVRLLELSARPGAVCVEIGPAALMSTPSGVQERFVQWTTHRAGVEPFGVWCYRALCESRAHACDVIDLLTGWGVPRRALTVVAGDRWGVAS